MKPIISDINQRSNWYEVEQIIESLYIDKKTFIRINWDFYYVVLPPTVPAPPTEDLQLLSNLPPSSQSNRKLSNAVQPRKVSITS